MVGDLIPTDDDVWNFVLLLVDILDSILSFEVNEDSINTFKINIKKHNEKFISIFKQKLKPKFHILTHYPEIMRMCGPVRRFWSFPFETKHRSFKVYAHAITSRKNIPLSLARKYQFIFADYLLDDSKRDEIVYKIKDKCECNLLSFISLEINIPIENLATYSKVIYKNVVYKTDYYVITRLNDYEVFKILYNIITGDSVFILCQQISNITFLNHYKAYEINPVDLGDFKMLKPIQLAGPPTTIINTARRKNMVLFKEY